MIHNCPAYQINDVLGLTIDQYNILLKESLKYESQYLKVMTQCVRGAVNADKSGFEKLMKSLDQHTKDSPKKGRDKPTRKKEPQQVDNSFNIDDIG